MHKHVSDNYHCFRGRSTADLDASLPGELESWLEDFWKNNSDVRRANQECIIFWCRLETLGVMTAVQKDWLLTFITAQLWQHNDNSVAVFLHTNRAEMLETSKEEPKKADTPNMEVCDDAGSSDSDAGENMSVRDTNRQFQKHFENKSRNLDIRDFRIAFEPESVYGKRRATADGFMVMANSKSNVYRKSPVWKRGLVTGVQMLPRKDFRKTPVRHDTGAGKFKEDSSTGELQQQGKLGIGQHITPVQALKQATAGTSLVNEMLSKLHSPSHIGIPSGTGLVCIDIFGYDAFAAEACFNLGVTTMSMCACATISHSHEVHTHVHNLVSRHIHGAARSGAMQIAGFPKFDTMIDTLRSQTAPLDLKLSVTTLLPCGALVINDALCTKFSMNDWTKEARHLDVCVVVCDCRIIKGPYLLSVFKGQVAVWKLGAPMPTKTHMFKTI